MNTHDTGASQPAAASPTDAPGEIARLLDIMVRLRDPKTGCPWDRVQDFDTIAPYAIEEAYEVADAIARRDWTALPDELGDLLLQIVYHARMAEEAGRFDFAAVARGIADKMVRRHPHVFGQATLTPDLWEAEKARERAARRESGTLAGIPVDLPALLRARKISARAARVGFDWPDATAVLAHLKAEIVELEAEFDGADPERLADELGDVLFCAASLARKLDLDPEACLRQGNAKFIRRFEAMERSFAQEGMALSTLPVDAMEDRWQAVKRSLRTPPPARDAD
ncbi:nucleotide pyrophosphohydrolase MazG [Ameyamaea chiangmaiensis NBRC 103196]|uniref:Nucleoside triphosphate pyrophosphohydrolase n=1 Tax=Ameyamaea chiangmaiensis TaxID=442969 RepID=A0A850P9S7_9PROT|nr:nucleoside triphosphate pyrophosphohydrolase [Ameyamaea chiangmaiensis]MBS4074947.1 nucleoside triphosphate pyrophosphohydrolase [Ameyamaea chiangmaiensis]NVN39713.1 nucleoside triphosphate pyrophosphohydrolase [Ameyamaea chiangmaiensis]GBQ63299.1 nucleotide pyrophosphohydrolase MazG [Ameyamaea chiangmaiensis NBRC 103196]